jgi:hypothetical protein
MTGADAITAIAVAAALAALFALSPAERDGVEGRLRELTLVATVLLAARLVRAITGDADWALVVELLAAAWLPMVGVRVIEEVTRRHAPRPLKYAVLVGGGVFSLVAIGIAPFVGTAASAALAGFQALTLTAMIALLLRERGQAHATERPSIDALTLTFVLVLPLAAVDYVVTGSADGPRGGDFALLLVVLTCSLLAAGRASPRALAGDLLVLAGAGLGAALVFGPNAPHAAPVLAGAAVAGAALLVLLERLRTRRADRVGLIGALALLPDGADAATVRAAHDLLSTASVLEGERLAALPPAALAALARLRVADGRHGDPDVDAAARELLDAAGATHLVRLASAPPRFLAVAAGPLAGPSLAAQLDMAARLLSGPRP